MSTPAIRVEVRSYRPKAAEDTHAHDHHQIVLPLAGGMPLHAGERTGTVRDGQGVFLPPHQPHRFRVEGAGNRFLVIDFAPRTAGLPDRLLPRLAAGTFFALTEPARHLLRYLEEAGGAADAATAHHALNLLLLSAEPVAAAGGAGTALPARVAAAAAFMEAHAAEPLTVTDIARAAGLGPSQLHAEFRRALGCGVAEYLRRVRLDRAGALLAGSTMPIAEVALACGYADQTALTRALRKDRGTTPAVLRRSGRI